MEKKTEAVRISLIVPVYNGEKYLASCMRDLKAQTMRELEIIFVDDGSTDQSGEMLDTAAEKDRRITVIHQENGGLSAARNAGIRAAGGEYVVFLDVDDRYEPYLAEHSYRLAQEYDADVVMYSFRYRNADTGRDRDNGSPFFFSGTKEAFFAECLADAVRTEIFNAPWNKVVRRKLLEETGLAFDPAYSIYEDILFAARLLQRAGKIVVSPRICYTYYVRSSGSLISSFREDFFAAVTAYYREAMEYCGAFPKNRRQKCAMTTLYDRLVILHLKQIALQKGLSAERKKALIDGIIRDPVFRKSLGTASLPLRKMAVKMLIYTENARGIIHMYTFLEERRRRTDEKRCAAETGL
jgi:glycosyltransferase involved in cell wall biosynthesis